MRTDIVPPSASDGHDDAEDWRDAADDARVVRTDEHVRRTVGAERQMDARDDDRRTGHGPGGRTAEMTCGTTLSYASSSSTFQ